MSMPLAGVAARIIVLYLRVFYEFKRILATKKLGQKQFFKALRLTQVVLIGKKCPLTWP